MPLTRLYAVRVVRLAWFGTLSGGTSSAQLQDEVVALSQDERQQLLTTAGFSVQITVEDTLAMKADLVIPWQKIRVMRR